MRSDVTLRLGMQSLSIPVSGQQYSWQFGVPTISGATGGGGVVGGNMPAGMAIQVQTGHITTIPTTGLGNFSMFSPLTPTSGGETSANLTVVPSPGTGLRITYPNGFGGTGPGQGSAPVRFGWGYGNRGGNGTVYFGAEITFSPNFPFGIDHNGTPLGVKMFEPRVWAQNGGPGPQENHIIPITWQSTDPPTNINTTTNIGITWVGGALQGPGVPFGDLRQNQAVAINIADGNKHVVEYVAVQNNPLSASNGTFKMWCDNILICSTPNIAFITTGNTPGWPYFMCDPVYGGLSVVASTGGYWQFDNLQVATL